MNDIDTHITYFFHGAPSDERDGSSVKNDTCLGGFARAINEAARALIEAYARADADNMENIEKVLAVDTGNMKQIRKFFFFVYNECAAIQIRPAVALLLLGHPACLIAERLHWRGWSEYIF